MGFIKKLLIKLKDPSTLLTMFGSSKKEIDAFLASVGLYTVCDEYLQIENYLFEPSIAFKKSIFKWDEIDDIDIKSYPPTIRIKDELIFWTSEQKEALQKFAIDNKIQIVERTLIWDWILEPFLDTEFTAETEQRLSLLLENYGLTNKDVKALRDEVETQMMKYNFDTMLWEWCSLGALDVLKAMRVKYNESDFIYFYQRLMKIALKGCNKNDIK